MISPLICFFNISPSILPQPFPICLKFYPNLLPTFLQVAPVIKLIMPSLLLDMALTQQQVIVIVVLVGDDYCDRHDDHVIKSYI